MTLIAIIACALSSMGWVALPLIFAAMYLDNRIFLWITWKIAGGRYDVLQPNKPADDGH